jgi:hypothetical protein
VKFLDRVRAFVTRIVAPKLAPNEDGPRNVPGASGNPDYGARGTFPHHRLPNGQLAATRPLCRADRRAVARYERRQHRTPFALAVTVLGRKYPSPVPTLYRTDVLSPDGRRTTVYRPLHNGPVAGPGVDITPATNVEDVP